MKIYIQTIRKNKSIRKIFNFLKLFFHYLSRKFNSKKRNNSKINFVVEKANWSIKWDGIYMKKSLNKKYGENLIELSNIPLINSKKKVIHFGSQYMWVDWSGFISTRNKYVVSFFHGKYEDGTTASKHLDDFIETKDSLYRVITASTLILKRLKNWGIPNSKLTLIPIGVDTNLFSVPSITKKKRIRKKLGFKDHEIVIGSFQKDGIGWSDGNLPKYIKGPDLFINSVDLISKEFPVVVLLTGPARGYVKNQLKDRRIKFKHIFLNCYEEIVDYYHALDLYIISSREEGGPKGIVESMASGVPLVSTNVGMASDFLVDNINGALVQSFEPEEIAKKSIKILSNQSKDNLIKQARSDVMKADWKVVADMHWEKVYLPALKELSEK
ncbi:MAG: glycosyltransferase family 4 protein [Prochlorococcus marinus CUG1438]|nr:glycosyltransferase family 4 protein [Prochlorococcus marinus CUG1438]